MMYLAMSMGIKHQPLQNSLAGESGVALLTLILSLPHSILHCYPVLSIEVISS